jgi:quercetin dioxygenase-like cupin family protein
MTMTAQFRLLSGIPVIPVPFGNIREIAGPASAGVRGLFILEGVIRPGQCHDFHMHPRQEEVIYVKSGQIEQWIGEEKRILGAGDAAYVPPGIVHGAFNDGNTDAILIAIFGPAVGDGAENVDMSQEAPWNTLRRR